ncbi:MAG TPA: hypothetical protein VIJ75_23840, partial [Hanamia sp.]
SLSISFSAFSQTYSRTYQYAEMVATQKLFSTKIIISIDFGDPLIAFKTDLRIKDSAGKVESFNSVVDAMNYLDSKGWEFISAFPVSTGQNGGSVYHYLFRRKLI